MSGKPMSRQKKKSFLEPIKQNFVSRLSNTDARVRRNMLRGLVVLVAFFMFYTFFSGDCGFIRIAKLHLEKNRLEKQNHELVVQLIDAEYTSERLREDFRYIEYIARSKHFFSKPGETIYRFK